MATAAERRFRLPPGHASVLADETSLAFCMPLALMHGGFGKIIDDHVEAYKNDTGVSWSTLGGDVRNAQAMVNRPFFTQALPSILEQYVLDDKARSKVHEENGTLRIADIGAGYAWSSIGVAKHFGSNCLVDAFDLDEPSIEHAKELIKQEGLEDRVHAYCQDAGTFKKDRSDEEPYDLVMALECVHDLGDPISVLRTMRELASTADGKLEGTVLVMDEKAVDFESGLTGDERFTQQLFYGFSCMCCLVDGKSHPNSAATGAVMHPGVLRAYAQQAGFKEIEILDAEHDFFRFYKLIG